ncbi:unnamed protein product [Amoebophrya sp. A120]|nr:unnamed protein product [Amoebophrya sp. A120]|eukprot:GSA120T00024649001.1
MNSEFQHFFFPFFRMSFHEIEISICRSTHLTSLKIIITFCPRTWTPRV